MATTRRTAKQVSVTDIEKPKVTTAAIHEEIAKDRANYLPEGEFVKDYRDYIKGNNQPPLSDKQRQILEGLLGKKFSENIPRTICRVARDRLRFLRWTCKDTAVDTFLKNVYKLQRIRERQSKIHFDTLRDGNHAVAVNWDNAKKRVQIYREPWYDGEEGLFIAYDALDNPVYAVKDWKTVEKDPATRENLREVIRRVIYYDDRFERWISRDNGATWEPFKLPEDNGRWPIPWTKLDGSPLGIPYVHFRNSGEGEDTYGASELSGGALGLVEQIMDTHLVLSGAARLEGYGILWLAGIKPGVNPATGKDLEPQIEAGTIFWSEKDSFRAGRIEPGNPDGILKIRLAKMQALANMTQTPFHIISGGDWPSGEALLRAEQPAVGKAESQRDTLENCWSSVAHLAVKVHNRFSTEPQLEESTEKAMIEAQFAPVERRDALSMSTIVTNLGDRISDEMALREMGWDEAKIKTNMTEKNAAADKAVERQNVAFNRGQGEGTNLPGRGPTTGESGDGAGTANNRANSGNNGAQNGNGGNGAGTANNGGRNAR